MLTYSIQQERSEDRRTETAGDKVRVLVVDDEQVIADSVARILRQFEFDATAVYGGEAAMEQLATRCPDVLLTDVLMPNVNGVDLAISAAKRCPKTRILLFSGQAATGDLLRQAGERGLSFDVLPKPLHPEQLLKALRA
jgi:CheY-like chemotaxis protein